MWSTFGLALLATVGTAVASAPASAHERFDGDRYEHDGGYGYRYGYDRDGDGDRDRDRRGWWQHEEHERRERAFSHARWLRSRGFGYFRGER